MFRGGKRMSKSKRNIRGGKRMNKRMNKRMSKKSALKGGSEKDKLEDYCSNSTECDPIHCFF